MSDAAKALAQFGRMAAPLIALLPDLERLGDLDALIAERERKAANLKAELAENQDQLAAWRREAIETRADISRVAAERDAALKQHKLGLDNMTKAADAKAAEIVRAAEKQAAAILQKNEDSVGKINTDALAQKAAIEEDIVELRTLQGRLEHRVADVQQHLDDLRARAKAFAGV